MQYAILNNVDHSHTKLCKQNFVNITCIMGQNDTVRADSGRSSY